MPGDGETDECWDGEFGQQEYFADDASDLDSDPDRASGSDRDRRVTAARRDIDRGVAFYVESAAIYSDSTTEGQVVRGALGFVVTACVMYGYMRPLQAARAAGYKLQYAAATQPGPDVLTVRVDTFVRLFFEALRVGAPVVRRLIESDLPWPNLQVLRRLSVDGFVQVLQQSTQADLDAWFRGAKWPELLPFAVTRATPPLTRLDWLLVLEALLSYARSKTVDGRVEADLLAEFVQRLPRAALSVLSQNPQLLTPRETDDCVITLWWMTALRALGRQTPEIRHMIFGRMRTRVPLYRAGCGHFLPPLHPLKEARTTTVRRQADSEATVDSSFCATSDCESGSGRSDYDLRLV